MLIPFVFNSTKESHLDSLEFTLDSLDFIDKPQVRVDQLRIAAQRQQQHREFLLCDRLFDDAHVANDPLHLRGEPRSCILERGESRLERDTARLGSGRRIGQLRQFALELPRLAQTLLEPPFLTAEVGYPV